MSKTVQTGTYMDQPEEYRSRENWLEHFIDNRCIREPNARVGARELYPE